MPSHLKDIALIFIFLFCGIGMYFILEAFTQLTSRPLIIVIAAGCRVLSLLAYRFYSPILRDILTWQIFEWTIPVVFLFELVTAACSLAPTGELNHFAKWIVHKLQ